jgi:hypothetical protein
MPGLHLFGLDSKPMHQDDHHSVQEQVHTLISERAHGLNGGRLDRIDLAFPRNNQYMMGQPANGRGTL